MFTPFLIHKFKILFLMEKRIYSSFLTSLWKKEDLFLSSREYNNKKKKLTFWAINK